jgi:starch-binding outer membrane protein, SusD/RagB family
MKNIKFLILIVAIVLIAASCKKSFLEEKPYSFVSSDALYNTDEGLEAAVNGCYATMADYGGYGAGYLTWMTVGSGGYYTTQGPNSDMNTLTHGASNLWLVNNSPWDQFYSAIKVANDILVKAPNGKASAVAKTKAIAEAYFMRGMLYFNLVRMFGGVPLRTLPPTQDDVNLPRSSKEEVYALVISDLEKAKAQMTATPLVGRPSKYAAAALLGKVYLTLAGNQLASATPYWAKAKTELLDVVANGGYALQKSYTALFTAGNENTKESIIEIQYSISGGPQGQFTNFFMPNASTLTPLATNGPFGRNRVNKDIFDRHRTQYPTDPRIDVNYIYGSFTRNVGGVTNIYPTVNNAAQGWPYIKKYVDPAYVATYSNRNFIYLRYADVLLMLAEIENELSNTTAAYTYVNQVMARARDKNGDGSVIATTPADWSGLTQDQFRDRIMRERRYELIGECHLWHDVRRRGTEYLKAFFNEHNNHATFSAANDKKYPIDAASVTKLMLIPIPEKEINANTLIGPADQNPGY